MIRPRPGSSANSLARWRVRWPVAPRARLVVRIDTLTLGPNTPASVHGGSSPDNIGVVVIINGAQFPVRATTNYMVSPIDQTMIEQSNHDRVSRLVQAIAYWIAVEV